jgi:rare lipoprotein A
MNRYLLIPLLLLALSSAASFGAAELVLKNGKSLRGTDVRLEGNLYYLQMADGQIITVPARVVEAMRLTGDKAVVDVYPDGDQLAEESPPAEERQAPSEYRISDPKTVAGGPPPEGHVQSRPPTDLATPPPAAGGERPSWEWRPESDWPPPEDMDNPRRSKWIQPAVDPDWEPEPAYTEEDDVTDFNPSKWMSAPDSTWTPTNSLDSTWVPQDGFKKTNTSLKGGRVTPTVYTSGSRTSLGEGVVGIRKGVASWYGEPFHGKTTASGVPFDMNGHTAAHPSLPFGTLVLVTNLRNGRNILLEVNDRGPSVPGREINLSHASARALDMVEQGLAEVRMEILER